MPEKIAGYVRVSTREQAEEGYSLDAQQRIIRAYCEAHGWPEPGYKLTVGAAACFALPLTMIPVCVKCVERMTMNAMHLSSVQRGRRIRPRRILCVCYRLQVVGVYATSVATQMVQFQASRDGANKQFVGDAMGVPRPLIEHVHAITGFVATGCPLPAITESVYFIPEPFGMPCCFRQVATLSGAKAQFTAPLMPIGFALARIEFVQRLRKSTSGTGLGKACYSHHVGRSPKTFDHASDRYERCGGFMLVQEL